MNFNVHNKIIEKFNNVKTINKLLLNKFLSYLNSYNFKQISIIIAFLTGPFLIMGLVINTIIQNSLPLDLRNESTIKIKVTEFGLIPNKIIIQPRKKYDLLFNKLFIADCFKVTIKEEKFERKIKYNEPFIFLLFYEGKYTMTCKWIYDMDLQIEVKT